MLEIKYFRDYKRSYMILQCMEDADKSYQCKLLTSGKVGDILRCSLRHVNGMAYFYYDISSRTTLESLYRNRQLSYLQVRDLFEQLYAIYCRLGDNFMEESRLVLLPEHIYYDFSCKKYIGLYYPNYEEDRPYQALMDFLLEHIDGQDEHLVDCMYQIYERTEESGFSLWDALQILGRMEEVGKEPVKEEQAVRRKEDAYVMPANIESDGEKVIPFYPLEEDSDGVEEKKKAPAKKKSVFYPFLTVLSFLGILGTGYVYFFFKLSKEEVMTLLGCGALMVFCFLVGFAGICRRGKREVKAKAKKNTKTMKEVKTFMPEEDEESFSSTEIISLEQVLGKEATFKPATPPKKDARKVISMEPEECGNTVFFDSAKLAEYKLYALDKKNKKHIELKQFPFTVGKMAGCVDCVLTDDSVSRIHAKFEKVGDAIQMTDMNSTNGTYKNGLRLQPQETVEIEPGDEIRFGNLNYCYR